ncbi:NAD-dependent epimerase/dehydratase family protein [Kibdelosporangium persicum]|nr:NAD(P)-dependent oxidoreductase [Kibdelosporangium persicum]
MTASSQPRVLVTGAAGRVGSRFAEFAAGRYRLRLSDRPQADMSALHAYGEVVSADLTDPDAMTALCSDVDTVVHLAGEPRPDAGWDTLLPSNVIGAYNVFEAAAGAGCRRLVFASSVHAVVGYPEDKQIRVTDPVNPATLYGVTKCFGEALGRYYGEQRGISVIALRIGAYQTRESALTIRGERIDHVYISPRDLNQLLVRAIEFDGDGFLMVNATSENSIQHLDLTEARTVLGYAPVDGFVDGRLHAE